MTKKLNKEVGARLRVQREYLGLTREGVSDFIKISPQFLSEIERGVKGVSLEMLFKLCDGLKISADYILMGREEKSDVSRIVKILGMLDKEYVSLAEELLKVFAKTIAKK